MKNKVNVFAENPEDFLDYLNSINNLYCIGRNGQHRYNNMDHSILTGIYGAKSFIYGSDKIEIWKVNTENDYHEKARNICFYYILYFDNFFDLFS